MPEKKIWFLVFLILSLSVAWLGQTPSRSTFVIQVGVLAAAIYWRFVKGRTGTKRRSAASIRLRSPQIPLAIIGIVFASFWLPRADVASALAGMLFYYSLRFGALRVLSSGAMFFSVVSNPIWTDGVATLALGGLAAFVIDLWWNHELKRRHILIPGFPRSEDPREPVR